ncbi:hypothetical protein T492DRAFT_859344 [Pavlovales sp. CCMP2436]|nr:hypothetical protein T492DRAFT_859344 [Pavlovales sp. CCMP2436]
MSRGLRLVAIARADIFAVVNDLSHAETQLTDETPHATKPAWGPYYITDTRGIHKPTCALCGGLYKRDGGEEASECGRGAQPDWDVLTIARL